MVHSVRHKRKTSILAGSPMAANRSTGKGIKRGVSFRDERQKGAIADVRLVDNNHYSLVDKNSPAWKARDRYANDSGEDNAGELLEECFGSWGCSIAVLCCK